MVSGFRCFGICSSPMEWAGQETEAAQVLPDIDVWIPPFSTSDHERSLVDQEYIQMFVVAFFYTHVCVCKDNEKNV